ncbi:MAG: hypothetical protein QM779_01805 [Propionicimonas sp.]|uniref:hypothetical protein n=1 Tax=Propionicimonas sp. TaxID=1955623 RepID=UPI003D138AD3
MPQYMPTGAPAGGSAFAWALPGFDQAAFDASVAGRNATRMQEIYYRHPDDEMHPEVLAHWQQRGVRKELFDADTDGKYSVFTPLDLDESESYALVYVSHGGMQPINLCETNGFPELAGSQKFIAVCPWNLGPSNDGVESEFPRILAAVRDRYPVDDSRIYAVGYSAGSDATGVLACAYPDILAAVSPDPGGNLFAKGRWFADPDSYAKNLPVQLPMICVGGTMDGGDRYPLTKAKHFANFNIWMKQIAKVSGYEPITMEESRALVEESPDPVKSAFGFDFDQTFTASMEGLDWLFGDFLGENGVAVARFVAGVGLPHAQTKYHAPIIWDFLRHFRRDTATGASVHAPVALDGVSAAATVAVA